MNKIRLLLIVDNGKITTTEFNWLLIWIESIIENHLKYLKVQYN